MIAKTINNPIYYFVYHLSTGFNFLVCAYLAWDTYTAASVGNAGGEIVDVGSFVESRQAALVVFTLVWIIGFNMSAVLF